MSIALYIYGLRVTRAIILGMQYGNVHDSYKRLMAAVVWRSLEDIDTLTFKITARQKDEAMAFILSPDCETLCLALGVPWERVKDKAGALYQRVIAKG
jgi:hypothetical protein